MDNHQLKVNLWNHILKIQSARPAGESQLVVRCPFCGDSQKDINHAHFYIKINLQDDEPVVFHCFRCDISGILTPSVLRTFKINDLQINSGLLSYNKKTMGVINKSLGIYNNEFNFKIPIPSDNEKTSSKQKYIQNRLGVNFSISELVNLKVIFNLGEFLKLNNIENITVKKEKAQMLHNDYVGFLTTKNEFINFRDITGKHKRYEKYSIYKNLDNTRKFYTIPNTLDILTKKTIIINIAEGVFDILGIYTHLYGKETKNIIYSAVCGAGFVSVLKYFIQVGVFGNVNINIYSDKDRSPKFYVKLKQELKDWVNDINLFYNEKDKDYGVPSNNIKIIKRKI